MKKILSIILALCMLLSLAACGSSEAETTEATQASNADTQATEASAEAKNPVTISFMHAENEEDRVKIVDGLIEAFMEEYDWITVDVIPIEEDDMSTKLTTMAQASNLPEVINLSQTNGQFLAVNDLIDYEALDNVLASIGGEEVFLGSVLDIARDDEGQLYVIPFNAWIEGIWVNKAMLEEKGMEVPETWDEILAVAEAFYDPANGKYGIGMATNEGSFSQETLSLFALSNGANVFDAEGNVTINTTEMKEALQFYKDLAQYTMPGSNGTSEVRDVFVSQNAPMAIYSTYILSRIVGAGFIDDVDIVYPTNTDSSCYGYLSGLTVTNQCSDEEQAAAELLMEFLLRKENVITWMHMAPGGPQPVLTYVSGTEEYLNNETIQAFAGLTDKLEEGLNNMQVFGTVGGKTFMSIGDIGNSGAIYKMAYNVVVAGADIDAELATCQATAEDIAG